MAGELFSAEGMLPDARANFRFGILPNPLDHGCSPAAAWAFVATLAVLAFGLAAGVHRRTSALLLWYGWACLFNRNNLISNPGLPYLGLLLLLTVLVPAGEHRYAGTTVGQCRRPSRRARLGCSWRATPTVAPGNSSARAGWTGAPCGMPLMHAFTFDPNWIPSGTGAGGVWRSIFLGANRPRVS